MPRPLEDYALIGDCETAALVGRDGSIDWLCFPRFDSPACFAALLGSPEHGRWRIAPAGEVRRVRRRYRDDTLVLETEFETDDGAVVLVDWMPLRDETPDLFRLVRGKVGSVRMRMELVMRFDYGSVVPWVRRTADGLSALAGPDALALRTPVEMRGEDMRTVAEFTVSAGEEVPFHLRWYRSHRGAPPARDPHASLERTEAFWRDWAGRCTYEGRWAEAVVRSLITLKALTYLPTGGVAAAPTTSLPERLGGVRNWDYRYCWLRDATFTLYALLQNGYTQEAAAWREWLVRAVAGEPSDIQIVYGVAGERRLPELELPWLPGYEGSGPVRTGNQASVQHQTDVYGEVADVLYVARRSALEVDDDAWRVEAELTRYAQQCWSEPDHGLWEVRGPPRHFTHSKVMAWVAFDRAVKSAERYELEGPVAAWRRTRDRVHAEVCAQGFDPELDSFVQHYGSREVDASLLLLPAVGFLPADDPRVRGTVERVERVLGEEGLLVRRYRTRGVDGLPPGEGAFLLCSFWMADALALEGRHAEATERFERLLALRNDVGLLAEEYDPEHRRMLGNFPQALSHVGLVNTACNLAGAGRGPAAERGSR